MTPEMLEARMAVEALRSGVPSVRAVAALGTGQHQIEQLFLDRLDRLAANGCEPLVFEGNFGEGKTHLLAHLRHLAENRGFVTSYVVVGPDMPLGNPLVVLKEIATQATAPGKVGRALRELAYDFRTQSAAWAELRAWALDADINDRFRAMIHLFEELHADEEFRIQILNDIQGTPLLKTEITRRLRELSLSSAYNLKGGPRNAELTPERIRLYARFLRALGTEGLVVLFDEVERIANFTLKQRQAAYAQIGWWEQLAAQAELRVFPVFAHTTGLFETVLRKDEGQLGENSDAQDTYALARRGIALFRRASVRLRSLEAADLEKIRAGVQTLYEQAYGVQVPELGRGDVVQTIRSGIRYWITRWDLERHNPEYQPGELAVFAVPEDTSIYPDEMVAEADDESDATEADAFNGDVVRFDAPDDASPPAPAEPAEPTESGMEEAPSSDIEEGLGPIPIFRAQLSRDARRFWKR